MNRAQTAGILTLALGLLGLMYANIIYQNREPECYLQKVYTGFSAKDFYVELPQGRVRNIVIQNEDRYLPVLITYEEMELTYLGTYFITAYCPAECGGSWNTSSGETCHRSDWDHRLSEPTTCAIDRRYHYFGEEFYIEEFDRTFVAEDTGPGVQGYWLDLFYEDYEDVISFPTGYYAVYSVEWVEVTAVATEEDLEYLENMGALEYYSTIKEED